jgi:hypothetical protein
VPKVGKQSVNYDYSAQGVGFSTDKIEKKEYAVYHYCIKEWVQKCWVPSKAWFEHFAQAVLNNILHKVELGDIENLPNVYNKLLIPYISYIF